VRPQDKIKKEAGEMSLSDF